MLRPCSHSAGFAKGRKIAEQIGASLGKRDGGERIFAE